MHTCSTGPERAGDWGQSQARLTATVRRTGGRAQPWLGWATHSHSQIRGVAGKEGMRIFIHCQGNSGGNKTATGDDWCVVIEEFQIFLGLGKWKFHIRTFIRLYRLVIILPLKPHDSTGFTNIDSQGAERQKHLQRQLNQRH